jgi:hypothetical protein
VGDQSDETIPLSVGRQMTAVSRGHHRREFIFSTILGVPIPGRPPVTDERARATLAIFWAKTRMHWKETNVHEHSGKHGDPIEVSTVRERITRRLARLAAESTTSEDPEASE